MWERAVFREPVGLELQPLFESMLSLIIFSFYQKSFTDKKPEKQKNTHFHAHFDWKGKRKRQNSLENLSSEREQRTSV